MSAESKTKRDYRTTFGVRRGMAQAWATPGLVVDRYFTKSYSVDIKSVVGQDQCVLQHSNKVCVVCIAPSHAILKSGPVSIDFNVNEKTDRAASKVRGKRKRGGQWLTAYSPLCNVHCKDGEDYIIYSCIRGDLLEVNEALIDNPSLLSSWPLTNGYIAVISPKHHERASAVGQLLTEEQYLEALEKRQTGDASAAGPSAADPIASSEVTAGLEAAASHSVAPPAAEDERMETSDAGGAGNG